MTATRLDQVIIGTSLAMQTLRDAVRRAAVLGGPVLIHGPTGAGKELVANGLHAESGRHGRFIACNAAAIPESLFESEIMGHVRGAFTDAVRDRPGLLRLANCGTVFLDEVGELYPSAQAKLLRVLDTQDVWSVGADSSVHLDIRFVTATNVDLARAVELGRFRDDLLHRLQGLVIHVPALRDHPDDIAQLTAHFTQTIATRSKTTPIILSPEAMERLEQYEWPGNIRELRQTIEHLVFLADGSVVTEDHVTRALKRGEIPQAAGRCHPSHLSHRRKLLALLAAHAGDVNAVAQALGVVRSTAYRRMRRLGIDVPPRGPRFREIAEGDVKPDGTNGTI